MHMRQQYRKTGKKYAETGCCVYTIYTQNFFKKCICKVSDIQQYLHKKCIYLYAYKDAASQKVYILIYTLRAASIKCTYLSATAGRAI